MSTATAEAPVKTAPPELPPLHEAFANVVSEMEAQGKATAEAEAPAKLVKTEAPVKQPEAKAPEKEVKVEKPAKKKDALDSVLGDETPTQAEEQPQEEYEKVLSAKDKNFDALKESGLKLLHEVKELREKVKKAPEAPPEVLTKLKTLSEEREKMAAELAQYKDAVIGLDVRYDPGTIAKMDARDKAVASVAARIKNAGGDAEALVAAMALPADKRSRAIDEAIAGVESQRELNIINARLGEIEVKDEEISGLLSNPAKTLADIQQRRELQDRESYEAAQQLKQALFEKTRAELPNMSKFMREAAPDAEDAEEFNADLRADLERAPSLTSVPREQVPILAYKAARYDSLEKWTLKRIESDKKRIGELESSLSKYEGGELKHGGDGKPLKKAVHEMDMTQLFQAALKGQEPV